MIGLVFLISLSVPTLAGTQHQTLSGLNLKDFDSQTKNEVAWQNNPFVKPASDVAVGELSLTGIIYSQTRSAAIINSQIVEIGDKIGSHEVVSIEPSGQVVLRTESGLFRLKMKGAITP